MAHDDPNPIFPIWAELETPVPQFDHRFCLEGTEWKRKTDWSRDGIIASDD